MKRTTKLQQQIENAMKGDYKLFGKTSGIASWNKISNSGKMAIKCESETKSEDIIIVIGAKNRYKSQGTKNAIIYR
jgi:hypothetical protein